MRNPTDNVTSIGESIERPDNGLTAISALEQVDEITFTGSVRATSDQSVLDELILVILMHAKETLSEHARPKRSRTPVLGLRISFEDTPPHTRKMTDAVKLSVHVRNTAVELLRDSDVDETRETYIVAVVDGVLETAVLLVGEIRTENIWSGEYDCVVEQLTLGVCDMGVCLQVID